MLITGHIDHIFATEIETRRGQVTLTSVWIIDRHDYLSPSKQEPTMYEVQFIDDKIHSWGAAITDRFADGDRVIAITKDNVEAISTADESGRARAFIKARGLDLAAPLFDATRSTD